VDGYIEDAFRPRPVEGVEDAVDVSVGDEFACARRQNGAVSCWGRNEEGQLGIGASGDPVGVATEVGELAGADQIALGPRHGCALVDGEVLCWGNNRSSTPTTVEGLTDVTAIGAGGHVDVDAFSGVTYTCRTCAVAGGEVWCWGREILGEDRQRVDGLDDPVELAVGAEGRDCALGADGRVLCWGEGFTRPDGVDWHDEPVVVEVPPDDSGE
jgi:serine/threonine-protein kinase